ncbi:MAG TPA: tRNA (adenosine(37)-N6)-threonylcarbamoyltransferase complex transferase subunit TsaD, partial [Bacteroidales bacterium]|nr:tRNA (adenosine(37)-N6)-threonylcarbamoyltransferase complex transferase subunit TsaD [Bacteroidales bacterium]
NIHDLCASIQYSIVDILMHKLLQAVEQTGITEIVIGGGVAANSELRNTIQQQGKVRGWKTHIPPIAYTTDNAAMVAVAAYYTYFTEKFASHSISPKARYSLHEYFEFQHL